MLLFGDTELFFKIEFRGLFNSIILYLLSLLFLIFESVLIIPMISELLL